MTDKQVSRAELVGLGLGWAAHVVEFVLDEPGMFDAYTEWAKRQPDRQPDERPLTRKNLHGAMLVTTSVSLHNLAIDAREREAAEEGLRVAARHQREGDDHETPAG